MGRTEWLLMIRQAVLRFGPWREAIRLIANSVVWKDDVVFASGGYPGRETWAVDVKAGKAENGLLRSNATSNRW